VQLPLVRAFLPQALPSSLEGSGKPLRPTAKGNGASLVGTRRSRQPLAAGKGGEKAARARPHCGLEAARSLGNAARVEEGQAQVHGPLKMWLQGRRRAVRFVTPRGTGCPSPGAERDRWKVPLIGPRNTARGGEPFAIYAAPSKGLRRQ